MNSESLVAKVWNFAHVQRDQGVSYQAYISEISYLLFLKMDEECVNLIGEPEVCGPWRRPAAWSQEGLTAGRRTTISVMISE